MKFDPKSEGPPCRHMENFLQTTADGRSKGVARLFALSHIAICPRCHRYMRRLRETIDRLRNAKVSDNEAEAVQRLAAGAWRRKQ